MEREQKIHLVTKMIEEFADTAEIAEFLQIAERLKKPDEPDIAEERWRYNPESCCVNPDTEGLPAALFKKGYGTDEQMILASKAPEMLDVLDRVKGYIEMGRNSGHTQGRVVCLPKSFVQEIMVIVKRARGLA